MASTRAHRAHQQHPDLWRDVGSRDEQVAAAALAVLAANRAAPHTLQQVATLLNLAEHGVQPAILLPALALLSRWARLQAMQPAGGRQSALLQRVVGVAQLLLANSTPAAAQPAPPQLAAACVLLLGVLAPALADASLVDAVTEAVGSALVNGQLGRPEPAAAADAMAAVGSILPCLVGKPVAACWLLSAVIGWLSSYVPTEPSCLAVDCLAPAYAMMRGAATAALDVSRPHAAVMGLLQPAYNVFKAAFPATSSSSQQLQQPPAVVKAAAAVLAAGGMAEALLRSAPGFLEAVQLAAELGACLVEVCTAAAAADAALAGRDSSPHAALLQDACSLAVAQLISAGRRPQLLAAAGVVRCLAGSLLHSALSLGPLCHAVEELVPPEQASRLIQRQLGSTLLQHAGGIASSLAAQHAQLDGAMRLWLLQQVQAAAQQAHRQFQRYSLLPPPAWLAAVDGAAVRQLLDKLFLGFLVLLVPELEAVDSEGKLLQLASHAQRAAVVAGVLAELQFCRLSSPPHYAALLKAVLTEVPGDATACATLAACLPCYAEVAGPCPTRGGQAAWLVDGTAAAKAQFLMTLLVPCSAKLSPDVLEERLAPLALLYLLHPHSATATAAHRLSCALLMALPGERRAPLAAYYVQRCLEGCPGSTPLPQLAQGLATIHEALPVGSPASLLCLHRLLAKFEELAAREDPSAPELAAVAAQQLFAVDYVLLDDAMAAFDSVLRPCASLSAGRPGQGSPGQADGVPAAGVALRQALVAALQRSDDCLRKPELARWMLATSR